MKSCPLVILLAFIFNFEKNISINIFITISYSVHIMYSVDQIDDKCNSCTSACMYIVGFGNVTCNCDQ